MRETFFAVTFVALVASGIGAYGIHRHRTDDIDAALVTLPGYSIPEALLGVLETGIDLSVGLAEHLSGGSPDTDAEREARARRESERAELRLDDMERFTAEYEAYRAREFSPEVDPKIRGICPPGTPEAADVFRCLSLTREALLALRQEREDSRAIYEHFYGWSRVLWGFGIAVALFWLYRAFRQMRAKRAALVETPPA